MAIDPPPGFRTELNDALAVLGPQIDGLEDLRLSTISQSARTVVETLLAARRGREQLIFALLQGMDVVETLWQALKDDGYPSLPRIILPPNLFDELQTETNAINTAMQIFAPPAAVAISLNIAGVVHTPQPKPAS